MEFFEKDGHRIIFGDAVEALENHVKDRSIDLIFVDPPYNIGKDFNGRKDKWPSDEEYLKWCYKWIDLCIKKLKKNGSIYLMASTQNMSHLDIYLRKRMTILSRIVWYYDSSGVQAQNYYGSLYEPILFAAKNKKSYTFNSKEIKVEARTGAVRKLIDYRKPNPEPYNSEKVPGNVWYIPRVRYRMDEYENHPSQKPIALLERIIRASSNEGDIILDPFSGTFTTSFVAKSLKRQSVGIEVEEEYVKIGLRRLDILTEYKEEQLRKMPKNVKRKNTKSKKYKKELDKQIDLFESTE